MNYRIDIQQACNETLPVTDKILTGWIKAVLLNHCKKAELTLRIVDEQEITHLNSQYRQKKKATNVLAFPFTSPPHIKFNRPFLGDVVVCPSVLKNESLVLEKPLTAHWAHIVVHGVLHLLGYDHIEEADAEKMQALEITLLAGLGFDNPYDIEAKD